MIGLLAGALLAGAPGDGTPPWTSRGETVAAFSFYPGALAAVFKPERSVRVVRNGGRLSAELWEGSSSGFTLPSGTWFATFKPSRHAIAEETSCPAMRVQIDHLFKLPRQVGPPAPPYPDFAMGGVTRYVAGKPDEAVQQGASNVWTGDTFAALERCWRDLPPAAIPGS